jgi:hypothetical protein
MMTKLHLLIPALFWQDAAQPEIHHSLSLPTLETLLAKSAQTQQISQGLEAWLCHSFGVTKQQNWPTAPILLQAENSDQVSAGKDYWLRADPVHLRIEQNHILLADSQMFKISVKESNQLADTVNQHFEKDELIFLPISPERWYVRIEKAPNIQLHSINQIAGTNINNLLPSGKDKTIWHNRFNEIQMLLHEHPINQSRQDRGELAINSLWFWGGGNMPQSATSAYTQIWSKDMLPRALALASETQHTNLPANAQKWLETAKHGNHLIVLDALWRKTQYNNIHGWQESLQAFEHNWFAPLYNALKKGQITQLTLTAIEKDIIRNFTVTRKNLWKFWNLAKPFSNHRNQ